MIRDAVRRSTVPAAVAAALLILLSAPRHGWAQGWVASRLDAPVLGALEKFNGSESKWQISFGYRYQKSDRHFRGTEEEENRQAEGSEVINRINLAEIGLRYDFDHRTSLSVAIPYLVAERSSPIRAANREVVDRSVVNAEELSDVTVVGRRLLRDPETARRNNVTVGLGIKIPTGKDDVYDTRERLVDGERVFTEETIDQSVQPGDGGWGAIVDVSAYQLLNGAGSVAAYASGAYLINPEGTNGVPTFRNNAGEEIMSIADQYVVRTGVVAGPDSWKGFSVGLGGRIEGVPVHDLIGSSEGFRRPGYAISLEPSVAWSRGRHNFSLAVPIALERNRQRSVPDLARGSHGDAAFADWVLLTSYWRRF